MNYYAIGQKIRKIRKAHGLSQEELAEKVGSSTTHMSHIETGNTKLSLPVFVDIANALEVLNAGVGQRECKDKGTGLWLYNGITTLHANHLHYKDQEKKFDSIFGGSADAHQQIAFNEIMKLAA